MKKFLFIAVLASMVSVAMAQDNMMSKRGTPILPEAGDWSIGIDAVPFIDWAFDKTRIMSTSTASSAGGAVRPLEHMVFIGKYMKDAMTAYRGRVGINFMSHSQEYNTFINNDSATGSTHQVVDELKTSSMSITLGAGIEKHRGKGRLQGIYGAEIMIGFSGPMKSTYTYGNAFILDSTKANFGSAYSEFDASGNVVSGGAYTGRRVTETKVGGGFSVGVDGFIGVEYFVLPKMSVSAEYNWGIMISSTSEGTTNWEETYDLYPATLNHAKGIRSREDKAEVGKSSTFGVGNGDIGTSSTGSVVFHFYF